MTDLPTSITVSSTAPSTLLHCFLQWETEMPERVYLTQPRPDGSVADYTWSEVGEQARRVAAYLTSLALPPKSSIVIFGKNSAHWIIADIAIWMAGHVSVPVYSTANAETLAYVLAHCEAKLMFVGRLDGDAKGWDAVRAGLPAALPVVSLPMSARHEGPTWDDIVRDSAPAAHIALPQADEMATIIYTSGSTGQPKGVVHSFRAMCETPRGSHVLINKGRGASHSERMLSYLPLAHTAERQGVEAASLCHGFRVFFNDSLETFAADLRRARPTIFLSVPRLWVKFYQAVAKKMSPRKQRIAFRIPVVSGLLKKKLLTALGLDQVHTAYTGSAALPEDVLQWYRSLGLELLEGYGMTENFAYSHFNRPGNTARGYVGECLPGVQAKLGDNGEVLLKSPGQMIGYFKAPELTQESYTADGFFRTGDRGEMDSTGRLRIIGRVKEEFKTAKGKYVAPSPIEARLADHPRLESVCVTGPGRPQPFALAVLNDMTRQELANGLDHDTLGRELEAWIEEINAHAEPHERLEKLIVVKEPWTIDSGLLTPTLKIRRSVIEERMLPRLAACERLPGKVVFE